MVFMFTIRRFLPFVVILVAGYTLSIAKPKLIVVISLDQFRYDYLTKFKPYYGAHGLRYLTENGANFTNAVYKHAFNMTGPGHAVILTGAYGNVNGIVGNNWYDQAKQQSVYCVADKNVSIIGANGEGRSPANLIAPTFGDELRLHTGFISKVISLSHKDRAAILMGGKMANGVFWMVDSTFVTSTYYMGSLPAWVQKFNASRVVNSFFGKTWKQVLPEDAYAMMDSDDAPYESNWSTTGRTFPHLIRGEDPAHITKSYYNALLTSPFSNEALAAFAKAAIEGEHLGQDKFPDLLCIDLSSIDYVGHSFGPHSREILEMAVQTDRLLSDFLRYIDTRIGLKNTVLVLTSDHGVTPIPEYVRAHVPSADVGRLSHARLNEFINASLVNAFGEAGNGKAWIKRIVDGNVYINHEVVQEKKLDIEKVTAVLADSLMNLHEVGLALPRQTLISGCCNTGLEAKMKRSFHPTRSGDVMFVLKPYFYLEDSSEGAEHGNPYDHDAHVPLIIVGEGIRSGTYATEASPADIGPTLSALIGVEFPAAREGRVLIEALKLP
jgi:predicted AlkP superfamily pyrophosphatase or phosphodiesterase